VKRLEGVHPDLVRVVYRAKELGPVTFVVTEGLRTKERQAQLLKQGASQTLNSRHLTGHAIDMAVMVSGKITWAWPVYAKLAAQVKEAARIEGVPIEWGGDWKTLRDGTHFQLPWSKYPLVELVNYSNRM
jgi:peptidoglycan L-alanyl-D-glutamate endopeptidase CwlK